jgi:hypothetical protein
MNVVVVVEDSSLAQFHAISIALNDDLLRRAERLGATYAGVVGLKYQVAIRFKLLIPTVLVLV